MKKKEEEIKDIFADLKTIVNTKEGSVTEKPEEKPKKKSHAGIKIGIVILIIILFIGSVVAGYFIYKSSNKGLPNDTETPGPLDDQGGIFNPILPILPNPGLPNNNPDLVTDPNTGDNNTTPPGTPPETGDNGDGGNNNNTTTDTCLNLGTINFNPTPGIYQNTINVTLNYSKPGCEFNIHYTKNGNEPTIASPKYTFPISVSSTTTIKAIVFAKINGTIVTGNVITGLYIINKDPCENLGKVLFDYDSGTYTTPISLKLNYEHPNNDCEYTIRYTIDETEPTKESTEYKTPISISSGTTYIKAAVFAKNLNNQSINGPIETKRYIINQLPVNPCANLGSVIFNPEESTHTSPITVDLTYTHGNDDCEFSIHYTLDETIPTSLSPKYTGGGIRLLQTTTIKAEVFSENDKGPISEKTYTINIPVDPCANLGEVIFNPRGATFNYTLISLTLANNTINPDCPTTIHYTTDGSEPKSSSPEYYPNTGISLEISENNPITVKAAIFTKNRIPQIYGPTFSETYRYVPEIINK